MRLREWHCFQHICWQPDRQELRRFAAAMLLGFLTLGLVAAWRRHGLAMPAVWLWSLGLVLATGAMLPGVDRLTYLAVQLPTSLLGYVMSHLLLTLMFLFVFTPLGIIVRLSGKDLLRLQLPDGQTLWNPLPKVKDAGRCYRQF